MTNITASPSLALKLDIDHVQYNQRSLDIGTVAKSLISAIKNNDLCNIGRICSVYSADVITQAVEWINLSRRLESTMGVRVDDRERVVLMDKASGHSIAVTREGRVMLMAA